MSIFVQLTGTLGKDPELQGEKTDQHDGRYCRVGLAVDDYVGKGKGDKDKDGNATDRSTQWIDCVFFKGAAEFIAGKAVKGDRVTVVGRLELSFYEKKVDGKVIDNHAQGVRVRVSDFEGPMRPTKREGGSAQASQGQAAPARSAAPARQAAPARSAAPAPRQAAAAAAPAPAAGPAPSDDDIPF